MTDQTLSNQLAEFVAGTRTIPAEISRHVRLCVLDSLGCGLFGSTLAASRLVRDMLHDAGSCGDAAVIGSSRTLSLPDAALVNGTSIHAFELDDLHPRSIVHPGSVVLSAALAASTIRPSLSGAEFVAAVAVGYEVTSRVGQTMGATHLLAGWHPTATHGVFGSAAAAAHILGLTREEIIHALGIAGTQAGGLMSSQYESMVKRFHAGRAAQSGVYAALLASRGYIGIRDVFGAQYGGYLTTFSSRADAGLMTDGLGSTWEVQSVGFKPYSTNGSCHPSIDILRGFFAAGVRRDDVSHVQIFVSTATVKHVGWPYAPDTVTTAQMNLPYICAVVLSDGEAFIEQFTEERICDPDLVEFSSRVHVLADPATDADGDTARHRTRIELHLLDGSVLVAAREHAHGSSRDPMTESEVRHKFRRLAATAVGDAAARSLEAAVDGLDAASDVSAIREHIAPVVVEA
jgi:2-methylcitrate dehydratase PrpD